ncbi:hypothetical protein HC891_12715 [Candidatus Gracilibacteria bacterium]|nr:hypothetical protein [Candidatus Gracilibacteria bacterium]
MGFFVDSNEQLTVATLNQGTPRSIQVPGPWQAQFDDLRAYAGVAWYRRSLVVERAPDQQQWYLLFGAVDYVATIYFNGELLAEHEGGYLPFVVLLGERVRFDEANELIVRVVDPGDGYDAPKYPFAEIPHGKQSWYGPIGGIWQSVQLEARHPCHVIQLHVTPDVPDERAHVLIQLSAPTPSNVDVRLSVSDPSGAVEPLRPPAGSGRRSSAYYATDSRAATVGHRLSPSLPARSGTPTAR